MMPLRIDYRLRQSAQFVVTYAHYGEQATASGSDDSTSTMTVHIALLQLLLHDQPCKTSCSNHR